MPPRRKTLTIEHDKQRLIIASDGAGGRLAPSVRRLNYSQRKNVYRFKSRELSERFFLSLVLGITFEG
jgi:hypothetical protein